MEWRLFWQLGDPPIYLRGSSERRISFKASISEAASQPFVLKCSHTRLLAMAAGLGLMTSSAPPAEIPKQRRTNLGRRIDLYSARLTMACRARK